jgi:hypothetical protein
MEILFELSETELDLVSGGAGSTSFRISNSASGARSASTTTEVQAVTDQTSSSFTASGSAESDIAVA